MRFNKQEMITLAQQPSNKFDKEGLLFVRERQEGFFRRTESEYLLLAQFVKVRAFFFNRIQENAIQHSKV